GRALNSISPPGRDNPTWYDLAGSVSECNGNIEVALQLYEREAALVIGSQRLTEKIADLRYRVGKLNDRRQATAETQARQQQLAREYQAQQQDNMRIYTENQKVANDLLTQAASMINSLGTTVLGDKRDKI